MFRSEALPILTIIANICAGSFTDLSRLESQSGAKKNMQTTRSWARKNSSKWQWALTKVQHGESRQVGNLDSKFWVYGLGFQAVRISQEKRKTRFDHFWPLSCGPFAICWNVSIFQWPQLDWIRKIHSPPKPITPAGWLKLMPNESCWASALCLCNVDDVDVQKDLKAKNDEMQERMEQQGVQRYKKFD